MKESEERRADGGDGEENFQQEMAWAFRRMGDDALRIAMGETKTLLDLSAEGELAQLVEQAGPVTPASILQGWDDYVASQKCEGRAKEAAEAAKRVMLDAEYAPLSPIPRRELGKAAATLRELVQIQGKQANWTPDSHMGQSVREIAAILDYRGMTLPDDSEQLRRMVAVYLWGKCQTCAAVAFAGSTRRIGMRLFIEEYEASMSRLRSEEAAKKAKMYALLGLSAKSEEERQVAAEENARSWRHSIAASNMKKIDSQGDLLRGANLGDTESECSEGILKIQQQEAFADWREWIAEKQVKLGHRMERRYHHFRNEWTKDKKMAALWQLTVLSIDKKRFDTLWDSYETELRRGKKEFFPAP